MAGERNEYSREWTAQRTARRLAQGVCTTCGVSAPAQGAARCQPCLNKGKTSEADRRERYRESKTCLDCGEPAVNETLYCEKCAGRKSQRAKDLREERKQLGLCPRCASDAPVESGKNYCRRCLDYFKEATATRRENFISQGLCGNCGKASLATADRCLACSRAATARRHGLTPEAYTALIAAGCRICGSTDRLHVDHDHQCCHSSQRKNGSCGKCVRGVLCPLHNTLVGYIEHPDVPRVIQYLVETRSASPLAAFVLHGAVHDGGVPDPLSRQGKQ